MVLGWAWAVGRGENGRGVFIMALARRCLRLGAIARGSCCVASHGPAVCWLLRLHFKLNGEIILRICRTRAEGRYKDDRPAACFD